MKVKIGSYPKHRWYHNFLYDWFEYSPERKVSVKLDASDTWSMDDTLGHIILPMLYQLAKTKHGSPLVDAKDVPEHLQGDTDEDEDLIHDRWDWVMTEMIWAFETKINNSDWIQDFCTGEHDFVDVPVLSSKGEIIGYEMTRGEGDTFKMDHEGIKVYQDRISNGFRLFGTYFESMWD